MPTTPITLFDRVSLPGGGSCPRWRTDNPVNVDPNDPTVLGHVFSTEFERGAGGCPNLLVTDPLTGQIQKLPPKRPGGCLAFEFTNDVPTPTLTPCTFCNICGDDNPPYLDVTFRGVKRCNNNNFRPEFDNVTYRLPLVEPKTWNHSEESQFGNGTIFIQAACENAVADIEGAVRDLRIFVLLAGKLVFDTKCQELGEQDSNIYRGWLNNFRSDPNDPSSGRLPSKFWNSLRLTAHCPTPGINSWDGSASVSLPDDYDCDVPIADEGKLAHFNAPLRIKFRVQCIPDCDYDGELFDLLGFDQPCTTFMNNVNGFWSIGNRVKTPGFDAGGGNILTQTVWTKVVNSDLSWRVELTHLDGPDFSNEWNFLIRFNYNWCANNQVIPNSTILIGGAVAIRRVNGPTLIEGIPWCGRNGDGVTVSCFRPNIQGGGFMTCTADNVDVVAFTRLTNVPLA